MSYLKQPGVSEAGKKEKQINKPTSQKQARQQTKEQQTTNTNKQQQRNTYNVVAKRPHKVEVNAIDGATRKIERNCNVAQIALHQNSISRLNCNFSTCNQSINKQRNKQICKT